MGGGSLTVAELIARARKCADHYAKRWAHRAEGREAEECMRLLADELERMEQELDRLVRENVGLAVRLRVIEGGKAGNGGE